MSLVATKSMKCASAALVAISLLLLPSFCKAGTAARLHDLLMDSMKAIERIDKLESVLNARFESESSEMISVAKARAAFPKGPLVSRAIYRYPENHSWVELRIFVSPSICATPEDFKEFNDQSGKLTSAEDAALPTLGWTYQYNGLDVSIWYENRKDRWCVSEFSILRDSTNAR